jgi:hypothetical protein
VFDPQLGKRRRHVTFDRTLGRFRGAGRSMGRVGRGVTARMSGLFRRTRHLREAPKPQPDDITLAHKVETEIFRDADVPKGQINVNAEEGVVYLRGEANTIDQIEDIVRKTRSVNGVRDVESLLHLPGTPAPSRS